MLELSLEHGKQPLNYVTRRGFGDSWQSRELAVDGSKMLLDELYCEITLKKLPNI